MIAVSCWEDRISPMFESSRFLLLADDQSENPCDGTILFIGGTTLQQRISLMHQNEVQTLLCGALTEQCGLILEANGIRVIPWLTGEAKTLILALCSGHIDDEKFSLPGCHHLRMAYTDLEEKPDPGQGDGLHQESGDP